MTDERSQFLLHMYDQMFNDINTHILVVWQSIGVVIGSITVLALVKEGVLPLDYACALIVLLCTWLLAHVYDASYWYNRNLVIIANIERQFLKVEDLKNIHYYFGKHRDKAAMLTHLRIQYWLGVSITGLIVIYHFTARVLPGLRTHPCHVELQWGTPYVAVIVSAFLLRKLRDNRASSYDEFLKNSPGVQIDISGIDYGVGHPIPKAGSHSG